ncbi:VanZ family protein [Chryseobacterium sp. FH1]|uniref:VanZ family protein n=1 Tax=Chryseobacterium sp. FH1 TaxID=1233951 RepID=UPI000E434980|nr:VanZ family protein [Chryseobacterium sp. FH1]
MQTSPNYYPQKNTRKLLDNLINKYSKITLPIYWAFLTYMLLRPGVENKEYFFMFPHLDKLIHFTIFFLLGFFFRVRFPKVNLLYYFLILGSYALLTEILQDTMNWGRSLEFLDAVADTLGLALAYYIYNRYVKFQNKI